MIDFLQAGINIDKDWIPYDYLPAVTVRKQVVKSQPTNERQTKSGFPTKTTVILFIMKTIQLCITSLSLCAIGMLSVTVKKFAPRLAKYSDKVFEAAFALLTFNFGFRYIFENFIQIMVTSALEIASY